MLVVPIQPIEQVERIVTRRLHNLQYGSETLRVDGRLLKSPTLPNIRPTEMRQNWEFAAYTSCCVHDISTIRHPALSNSDKNRSQASEVSSGTRTLSYTKARFSQPDLAESGPNIGCVQSTPCFCGEVLQQRFASVLLDREDVDKQRFRILL